jgi:DNA-binding NarL/FixJ family response regulator
MFTHLETRAVVLHEAPLVTSGLVAALRKEQGVEVLTVDYDSTNTADLIALCQKQHINLVITDYVTGVDLASAARRPGLRCPAGIPKVLIISTYSREWEVRSALENGAFGYLLLNCDMAEVITAVHAIRQGRRYLCAEAAQKMADALVYDALTSRETDVLRLIEKGCCNKTVAMTLGISLSTVKTHVKAILEKLGVASRTEAAFVAFQRGMLDRRGAEAEATAGSTRAAVSTQGNRPEPATGPISTAGHRLMEQVL